MGDDLKELKSVLRSLVVSSPTQMDVWTLLRDYRNMMGGPVPLTKYGHRDPVAFLKERFSDCFLFGGPTCNPVLTLIVPDTLKHIDQFVQKQKISSTSKIRSKRRSIPEAIVNSPKNNLIHKTFPKSAPVVIEEPKKPEVKAPDISNNTNNSKHTIHSTRGNYNNHTTSTNSTHHINSTNHSKENNENQKKPVTSDDVKNFLKKRLPVYNSFHNLGEAPSEKDGAFSLSQDDDSGKHTSSSSSSTKALQFEELKSEIMELITTAPQGVWCTDLIRLYRERYKRELNFARFGYTSIISLVYVLEQGVQITRPDDTGDWLLHERRRAAPAPPALRPRRPRPARPAPRAPAADPDDALPGVDFDPDVFPDDCLHFMESIPPMSLADFRPGAMLEVIVGEVYSPSHFWLIRLGDNYNIAMENLMDEMTLYYNGEGRERVLARGAVRVGHYCSSLYDKDWHRSLIVKIVDSDTVKVRHVDYGTVDTVGAGALRPLRRAWARLPAQAVRARLAGVRPSAAGRRWPHAAAAHFLRAVRDARLVANVVAVDADDELVETLLIDTAGADDACVSAELVRAGHADARPDSALRTAECYLYPRFEALESGATPNFGEIHAYLRDGIALDYVQAYRDHVPAYRDHVPAYRDHVSAYRDHAPAYRDHVPADTLVRAPPLPPAPPSPPAPPPPLASDHSPDDTLDNMYDVCVTPASSVEPSSPASSSEQSLPTSSAEPSSPAELATRIPLMWPGAPPPPTSPSLPWVPPAPRAPAPPAPRAPAPPAPRAPAPPAPSPPRAPAPPPPAVLAPPVCAPPVCAPPVYAQRAGQWPGVYAAPCWPGLVTLSVAECETYRMLARNNPAAAHWYMAGALGRAMGAPPAPCAPMRPPPAHMHPPPAAMRPPPGFGG